MLHRLIDVAVPARLGRPFRWLLGSVWASNLGDGLLMAAGPLLVAARTDAPLLVSLAVLVQWLPGLLFGLWAGAVTDRIDRRRLAVAVEVVRLLVLAGLATAIATDAASIALVLVALFVLGVGETFADTSTATMTPMVVHRDDLAVGNTRIQGGFVTMNLLAGPPIGAALFAIGQGWPFAATAVLVAAGIALLSRVQLPAHGADRRQRIHLDIVEGVRWAWRHPAVRTLVLTISIFNVTFGAAFSVLVLYAQERLGLGSVGFGLLTTVQAIGGLIGMIIYGRLATRLALATLMRIGLILETVTHLVLAVTSTPAVAYGIFLVLGVHEFVWGTTSTTIRQRAVPAQLQGRVNAVNRIASTGGLVVGAAVGGLLAQGGGVTAPFWFGFAGSAVFVVLIWAQLRHIAASDTAGPADTAGPS